MVHRIFGIGMMIVGVLIMFVFPVVPTQQSSVCVQSIVAQVTVCAPDSSYLDSVLFNNQYTIAPAPNSVYVYLSSGTTLTGTLKAYYFLSEGAMLSSSSASVCSTSPSSSCTPGQALSGIAFGTTSAGVKYLTVASGQMNAGTKYVFKVSITDSKGIKSSLQGAIIPATPQASYTATATTLNGTFTIGGSNFVPTQPVAFAAYTGEGVSFKLQVASSLAPISSVTLSITPGSSSAMTNLGGGTYRSFVNFAAAGSYTVEGKINFQGGGTVTAFSVRITALAQLPLCSSLVGQVVFVPPVTTSYSYSTTTSTTTSISTSSATSSVVITGPDFATSTASCYSPVQITLTEIGTFTITDSTTYVGTDDKTTTKSTTNVCDSNGCTGTTTTTVVGGGSTTSATASTTSTHTTTTIGDGGGGGTGDGFANFFIGGFVAMLGAVFLFRGGKRG